MLVVFQNINFFPIISHAPL